MNERLQEISDFVDDYFCNKKQNTTTIILDNNIIPKENKTNDITKYNDDKMNTISKLFNIDEDNSTLGKIIKKSKHIIYNIKYNNKNINNLHMRSLSELYIAVIYCINKKLLNNICKKYLYYIDHYEEYISRFADKNQRKKILLYLKSNNLEHNIFLETVKQNKPYIILVEKIEEYKKSITELKQEITNINRLTSKDINIDNEDHQLFNNIVTTYQNKIDKIYKFINKFNTPEMIIYNFIVEKIKETQDIINIFTHFTLPVKRQNSTNPLYADLLIVINLHNTFHFVIIEYDGPTHNDINDFRFCESIVLCDMTKNNYCINNNISLFRLNYKINMNEHLYTIDKLINQIIITKKPIYYSIPSDNDYHQILSNYYTST